MAINSTGMYVIYELNGKTIEGPSPSLKNAFEVQAWNFSIYHPSLGRSSGGSVSAGIMQVPAMPVTSEFSIELIDLVNANKMKDHMKATFIHVLSPGGSEVQKDLTLVLDQIYLHNLCFSFEADGKGGRTQVAHYTIDQVVHKGTLTGYKETGEGKMSPSKTFEWNYDTTTA
jgi:hypothetical protein